jgi:hypothetical protein
VPGGMADSDLEAREQRIADYRLCLGNAPLPAWGPFLLDRRPRTKTFAGFASGRLTLPKHAGGPGSKQPGPSRLSAKGAFRPFTAWPGFLHYALHLGLRFAGNRGRPKRDRANERTASDLSQLGAFSRNRAVTSFNALDRSNTGSAKNTPKSDMDLLARIQHLASLNWASHRMVARSPTSRAPGPAARSRMLIDIFLSLSRLS